MQITFDLLDGVGARDYSAYVLEEGGLEVRRVLNRPSQCGVKLLLQGPAIPAPQIGALLVVARATQEALFTGAVSDVEFEYLGWGEQGPVHAVVVTALSAEATVGGAVAPGGLTGATTASAGLLLAAQVAGAAAVADDGGFAEGIQIPAIEVSAGESAQDVMDAVASQSRLSYRVHSGQLVVQPLGAVVHNVASVTAAGSKLLTTLAPAKTTVTVNGKLEAQGFVSEYIVCDGTTSLIPVAGVVEGAQEKKLFYDAFGNGKTALAVSGATSAVSVGLGSLGVNATGSVCEVAVGAPVELGGRVLFEVSGVTVQSCGAPGLIGLISDPTLRFAQNGAPSGCFVGFEFSLAGGSCQFQAVVNGLVTGSPVVVKAGAHYALRVRLFAPMQVRRTQVFHSWRNPASNGLGGRDVASWASVHCEIEETTSAGVKTLFVLAAQTLATSPSFATAVVVNATQAALTLGSVKVAVGPSVEARYVSGGSERLLRFGTKAEGAEAWLSNGPVKLSFKPAAGDVLKLRYRTGDLASATAVAGNPTAVVGEKSETVRVELPVERCTEDCENAAAALVGDASDPSALLRGELVDAGATLGTNIWPGETVAFAGQTGIVREVAIQPLNIRTETLESRIKFANDGASSIAIKTVKVKPTQEAARGIAGTVYASELNAVQVSGVGGGAIQVDCGVLMSGGLVEVRSTAEGWGQSTAGLVMTSASAQFSLPQSGTTDEFYLKQTDGSGHYSREVALVRTSL